MTEFEHVEVVVPLLVTRLGKYADDCLRMAFSMAAGDVKAPVLDALDFQDVDTFKAWNASAPKHVQETLAEFVKIYQVQSMRFKAWIMAYNAGQRVEFSAMPQSEVDRVLVQKSLGAIRATLELRYVVETLWGYTLSGVGSGVGSDADKTPAKSRESWLADKFMYCDQDIADWPYTTRVLAQLLESPAP